jgi:hypothetical protein
VPAPLRALLEAEALPPGLSEVPRLPAACPLQSYLPVGAAYFRSERSFAQLRLPTTRRALVGFGKSPTTLLVVGADGTFYKASFDAERGGPCEQQSVVQFD